MFSVWEWSGLAGAIIYAASYILTSLDRLPSQSPHFYVVKLVAAILVMISLVEQYNLATVLIQTFFIVISVFGIARHLGARQRRIAYERSLHGFGSQISSDGLQDERLICLPGDLAHQSDAPAGVPLFSRIRPHDPREGQGCRRQEADRRHRLPRG
ncbi:hypothetical protein SAMN04488094_110116 [Tropicimonas isoalkanivorans]|uniref:CBU-0592-like domain-containing protein n=2 Tax=Tropicimonas isoalkanivorans TaxID=441112 RepID=A0A1I1MZ23_9RHOB|nr:hypothetical protein SAMN04488094_110116 [Tropicimonas isoalkanivorans]